jgi:hypothetical protein
MFTQICSLGTNVSIASIAPIAPQKVAKICNPPPFVQLFRLNQRKLRNMRGTCVFKQKWTEMPLLKTLRLGWFFTYTSLLQKGGEDAIVLAGNKVGRLQEGSFDPARGGAEGEDCALKPCRSNAINVVLTASNVAVEKFCLSLCGTHGFVPGSKAGHVKGKNYRFIHL